MKVETDDKPGKGLRKTQLIMCFPGGMLVSHLCAQLPATVQLKLFTNNDIL